MEYPVGAEPAKAGKTRRIVVCGDDFGMNSAVDGGILLLTGMGRMSAVSCLSLGPSFAANARVLRHESADVGLHLDLTDGLGGLSGMPLPLLIASAYTGRLRASWVDERLNRQLDAFEQAYGDAPVYVDGHRHVHQLPGVLSRLLRMLEQRYGARRPWLRCTVPAEVQGVGRLDAFKARVIGALGGHAVRRAVREQGWCSNGRLLGVYGLSGGAGHYAALLRCWLDAARDGDLLMCHPATPAWTDADPLQRQRAAELEVLSHADLADWMRARGLEISRLSQLLPGEADCASGVPA